MAYDRFFIGPVNSGLETDLKPFLLPDDAFALLNNAYVFRGRVRKRFGETPLNIGVDPAVQSQYTRLRLAIPTANGITDAGGNAAGFVPYGIGPVFTAGAVGQMFSIGDQFYTVISVAAGAQPMLSTMGAATFDALNGTYAFVGAPALTQIYYYPAYPVMGFITYQNGAVNNNPVYAFDTKYAYYYTVGGGWDRLGDAEWTGSDSQFFQGTTWHGNQDYSNILFVTNFNQPDQLKYWDGAAWATFNPLIDAAGHTLETARILIVFKDRLLALNTIENIGTVILPNYQNYQNRVRFSQNGSPLQVVAGNIVSWRQDLPGKGNYLNCPTKEQIITAQLIKDRLIVFFETSTWELVYTGNEILPFRWQQINTELGAESTFSEVPFDKVVLGIANVGIHACNGANVERIDEKIPDEIFRINQDNNGPRRVNGIRDYYVEMVYWSYPVNSGYGAIPIKYPNSIFVYNYRAGTWATNTDSITAFGYYEQQAALTWAIQEQWQTLAVAWNSSQLAAIPRKIIAGNQEGFTFLINPDHTENAVSLQVTNIDPATSIFTVIDHNLPDTEYVILENCQGIDPGFNGNIYLAQPIDANTLTLLGCFPTGAYTGGGTLRRVSRIDILTKQYNLYLDKGRNAAIMKIDFQVDNEGLPDVFDPTRSRSVFIESFPSYSSNPLYDDAIVAGCQLGTNLLQISPYYDVIREWGQTQLWHPIYFQSEGESVQFEITLTDALMRDPDSAFSDFQLNAFIIYAQPTSARPQ